jgi:hypothetical protein
MHANFNIKQKRKYPEFLSDLIIKINSDDKNTPRRVNLNTAETVAVTPQDVVEEGNSDPVAYTCTTLRALNATREKKARHL